MKKLEIQKEIVSESRLTWNEKALISLISRHQNTDVTFTLTDKKIASELGLKPSSIYGLVSNLAKLNIITKHTDSKQINAGQKPKNVRYITLIPYNEWFTTSTDANTSDLSHDNPKDEQSVDDTENVPNIEAITLVSNATPTNEIIVKQDDCVSNESYLEEFLKENPNYQELEVLNIKIDFEDGDEPITTEAYFYKEVDGVKLYIEQNNVESYINKTGLYKKI